MVLKFVSFWRNGPDDFVVGDFAAIDDCVIVIHQICPPKSQVADS